MAEASSANLATGHCLCGAVRFSVRLSERGFGVCHCGICRRLTGGPFFAVECTGGMTIDDDTNVGIYRSSEWAERGFCKACGTPLFYRLIEADFYAVSLEALDDRDGFAFTGQVFIDEKPPYYDFSNATKTMTGAEVFAAFGASEGNSAS